MSGALAGIRVIEFANYVSGPYAGMLLGDLGADIVKVEEPTKGDPFRGWGRVEYSPTFGSVNRNKKSVTIDLKSEIGKADARDLIRTADVVIENFRVGTMDRLGLGYEAMRAANPSAVSISASRGARRFTRPRRCASSAGTISPSSSISIAALRGTARAKATAGVEQNSPISTPGVQNRASSAATAKSQLATNWQPAAVATPCTAAITG